MDVVRYNIIKVSNHIFYAVKTNEDLIYLATKENFLTDYKDQNIKLSETPFFDVIEQLENYFSKNIKEFNLKIKPEGTIFQKKVWNTLLEIPYGKTASYEDIAIKVGGIKYSRAVGTAISKNPILIIIPCHRVIRKNGDLGGFSSGIDLKRELQTLEIY